MALRLKLTGGGSGFMGSVVIVSDSFIKAFVAAERALVWQLTDETGEGVVRERNWLTFQAGEIGLCVGCHGINDKSQVNTSEPQNSPLAPKEPLLIMPCLSQFKCQKLRLKLVFL